MFISSRMYRWKPVLIFFCISALFAGCSPEPAPEYNGPLLFGHRATGRGVQEGFIENTIPAVVEALKYADGVEQDIQMSADSTLWIYHDDRLDYLCDADTDYALRYGCIPNTPDSVLHKIQICRGGVRDRIYTLESLFERFREYPDKYVSLDVKGYFEEECIPGHNVSPEYQKAVARRIYRLVTDYGMRHRVFVETDYTRVFEELKALDPKIRCTLLSYADLADSFHRSARAGWDGVSFNLDDSTATRAITEKSRRRNQILQLWTIYSKDDFKKALKLQPTTVQISDLKLLRAIAENKTHPGDSGK